MADGRNIDALLQRSEELTANLYGGDELPRVKRNLTQVLDAGKRLWSKTAAHGTEAHQVKAALLLGQHGIEIGDVPERLKNLETTKNLEPLEAVQHTDIEGFLKNEHENAILSVIAEQKIKTFDEVTERHWETRHVEWDKEKTRILSTLLGADERLNIGVMQKKAKRKTGESGAISSKRSMLDENELLYSQQVQLFTDRVSAGGSSGSLVAACLAAARQMGNQSIEAIWTLVDDMLKGLDLPAGRTAHEQRKSDDVQHQLINAALSHLETCYYQYIQSEVDNNLREAQRGALPGIEKTITSFLNVKKVNRRTYEDGDVWAVLFYCLRCGQYRAAVEYAAKHQEKVPDFYPYLVEWVESPLRLLSPNAEDKLKIQYRRTVRNSTDPYKRAVYAIVGKCDSDIHQDVIEKTDDYVWLKLAQVVVDKPREGEYETIQRFQQVLLEEYGEKHFQAEQSPLLYFQVLFLSGQFEAAIEFLARSEQLRCHAVHIALCLYDMGLLLIPGTLHAKLLTRDESDPVPFRRLNFARLIMTFTRKFEQSDPQEALQYFYFLRDIKTPEGGDLFMQCVSQLVRDSREFSALLGRMDPATGARRPGAIDKFFGDTSKIILKVAADCEHKGLFEEAINLFDLGKQYNKVVNLLSSKLSQVISEADKYQSDRNRLKQRAQAIAIRYRDQSVDIDRPSVETFHLILDLMNYFDLYHAGEFDQALEVIRRIDLLPLNLSENQRDVIQRKVTKLSHYSEEIRRSLSEILLSVMNILLKKYKNIQIGAKRNLSDQGQTAAQLAKVKEQAKSLINFAGMVPYRLPGDTNMRLVQYEVKMN